MHDPGTTRRAGLSRRAALRGAVAAANSQSMLFELDTPGASDLVQLTNALSSLNIGSGTLEFDDFVFTELGGLTTGTYTLFDTAAPLAGTLGSNLSGPIGAFTGTLGLGDNGNDNLVGARGKDTLQGGNGNDTLNGTLDVDSLLGGNGDDSILGADGRDFRFGQDGNDILKGGEGNDSMSGGDSHMAALLPDREPVATGAFSLSCPARLALHAARAWRPLAWRLAGS